MKNTLKNNWGSRAKSSWGLDLKPVEETKAIKDNNLGATIKFNDLIIKRKKMSELYDSVDKNKLYFEYVGPTN